MTLTWLIIGAILLVFAIVNRINKSEKEDFEDRDNWHSVRNVFYFFYIYTKQHINIQLL